MNNETISTETKTPLFYFKNYLATQKAKAMMDKIFSSKHITSIKNDDIHTLIKDWRGLNQQIISIYGFKYHTTFVKAVFAAMTKHGYKILGYSPTREPIAIENGEGIHNRVYFYKSLLNKL